MFSRYISASNKLLIRRIIRSARRKRICLACLIKQFHEHSEIDSIRYHKPENKRRCRRPQVDFVRSERTSRRPHRQEPIARVTGDMEREQNETFISCVRPFQNQISARRAAQDRIIVPMHLTANNERQRRSVVVSDVGARDTTCCRDAG